MGKIYWEVPYFKQEAKDTCGIAALRMMLAYYGIEKTEKELVSDVYMHKFGSWYSDLAKQFLINNIKTKIYTINVNLYSPFWVKKSAMELKELLTERTKSLKGLLKTEIERATAYIDMGGKLEVRVPNPQMIEDLIQKGPIFIPILKSFTVKNYFGENGHYVVLNGFDGENYSVLDPAIGKYEIDKEFLYYAWLANNRDSDGYLLEVLN